jgi:hypothetical protein
VDTLLLTPIQAAEQVANFSNTVLDTARNTINTGLKVQSYFKTTALSETTGLTRVEPLTIVSKDLLTVEYLPDIMQSLLNMFSGYYLQAVNKITTISDVRVAKILDRLSPDRDMEVFLLSHENYKKTYELSAESFKYRLPLMSHRLSLEDNEDDNDEDLSIGGLTKDQINHAMVDLTNLAVGKLLTVVVSTPGVNEEGKTTQTKVTIPISVRLAVTTLPNQSIEHIFTLQTEDNTLTERWHKWRSGQISFIKDLILCQDLIDEHKKALMNDKTGVYNEIVRRATNAKKYGLLTNNPSLASASNLFVISDSSAKIIEAKFSGKLANPRVRQSVFENTYAMIIAVVNREWERVTFYTRGIAQPTEVSIKDIKASNKGKGPDIMDVIKSLTGGNAPSF